MQIIKPLSPKQLISFQDSNAKINIWVGSVRSGKTYVSLARFLDELESGPPGEYCILARTQKNFKQTLFPILCDMIGSDAKYYSGKTELHIWGKVIHTIGCDSERAEARVRGPTFQGAYVDEATIIPESVFQMLKSRCAMGNARIFATTNPDSPFHWLKRDYLTNNKDVRYWNFSLKDNPQLTDAEISYLQRQYHGLWYQRYIEGKWVQAEGAIYQLFSEQEHTIDYPPHLASQYFVGVDYGTTNPCAFVMVGYNPHKYPNLWVEREYYYDSRANNRQKTDAEYAQDFRDFIRNRPVTHIYIDPSAASFRLELVRGGIDNIYDAENEVLDGIRIVSRFLWSGKLKICRNCHNLIKEIQTYVWDEKRSVKGEEKPVKEHDHLCDALRYVCYTHFKDIIDDNEPFTAKKLDESYRNAYLQEQNIPHVFQQPKYI